MSMVTIEKLERFTAQVGKSVDSKVISYALHKFSLYGQSKEVSHLLKEYCFAVFPSPVHVTENLRKKVLDSI